MVKRSDRNILVTLERMPNGTGLRIPNANHEIFTPGGELCSVRAPINACNSSGMEKPLQNMASVCLANFRDGFAFARHRDALAARVEPDSAQARETSPASCLPRNRTRQIVKSELTWRGGKGE